MIDTRFFLKSLPLCLLALSLTSCGSSQTYSSIEPGADTARARANLQLPPDLMNTASNSLVKNSETAKPVQVLPKPQTAHITRNDAEGWLDVDLPADKVWNRLLNHWASLGVDLVINDPKTGIMETDWVRPPGSRDKGGFTAGMWDKLLGRFANETTELDKYTIRLERRGDSETRVYVTEKGVKKIQDQKGGFATFEHWSWVATKQDPNKVRLALSSIEDGLEKAAGGKSVSQQAETTTPNVKPQLTRPYPTRANQHGRDYEPPLMR